MHQQALGPRERVLSKEHPDTPMSIDSLALTLRYQGKYEQSEEMSRQSIKAAGESELPRESLIDTLTSGNE